ncbi:MAG: sigma-70 family RNA polymerase sigma factor [Methanobrevibacter sp.]|uniref:sigma-70 family RNA polymerase sigma factor n=1 Tax=Methanobrevibacter sp. TaxID=66852 RepID=UPI0031F4A29E|nr:sigma-70 family RNA polymerase sigma factor [Methanobrevibacter sp.]
MTDEKLVYYVYNKFEKNNFIISNKDDLIQEGFIGLLNAKKTYDSTKNIPFHNYAITCIKNSMSNYIRQSKKHNSNISIYEKITDDLQVADVLVDDSFNIEDKIVIEELLNSQILNEKEKNIIKLFLQGYSRANIKKMLNTSNSYLYKFFKKINVIINDFTR